MRDRNPLAQERLPGFAYRASASGKAELYCEGRPLGALAARFGTPLYVYSAATITRRVEAFERSFRKIPHTICYSVKANSNLSLLRFLAKMGCGFDVVSGGELERVARADKRAVSRVVFSGVGKTKEEITAAIKARILLFNLESESELRLLAQCASRAKRPVDIAFRVNPDVPAETHPYISTGLQRHKFGIPISEAKDLYAEAAKYGFLRPIGVSVHIGSQITSPKPFGAAMERVADLISDLRSVSHRISYVDCGGGLGISYTQDSATDFQTSLAEYASAVISPLQSLNVHLLLEPGRAIVGPAGVLLTRVLYEKRNGSKRFVIVDAAMNDLIRPSLYQAHHEIVAVKGGVEAHEIVDVVGPVCETGDFFARDRTIPVAEQGDLLAVLDTGAYGMALASNYNSRPRAAEVWVDGKSVKLIRRRETINDLLRNEV